MMSAHIKNETAKIILETAVGRVEVYVHHGAGLGATTLNGYSIQRRSNNAMRDEGRAIPLVAYSPNG
ncbi:MAG: hypothetical protein ACYCSS_06120 [Sulfuriferula sp.]